MNDTTPNCYSSRLELSWTLKNTYGKLEMLAQNLSKIRTNYDLILIDCPPTESMLTEAAYLASEYILVPVKPEFLCTIGLPLLVRSLKDFKGRHEAQSIKMAGIVFNSVSENKEEHQRSKSDVKKVASENGWYVFDHEITYSDSYPKGSRVGKPIFQTAYARGSKVAELRQVAQEFLGRVAIN